MGCAPIRQARLDGVVGKPVKMHSYGEFPNGGNAKLSLKRQHGVKCKPSMEKLSCSRTWEFSCQPRFRDC